MNKLVKKIKGLADELKYSVYFRVGIIFTIITAIILSVCVFYYNIVVQNANNLIALGTSYAEVDLSSDYYDEISSRFENYNGKTYKDYKMMGGIGISFYGDGGIIDESSGGYTVPALVALNFLDRYVYIMGNQDELPEYIAARQGGVPMHVKRFSIPAKTNPVKIRLYNEYCESIVPTLINNGGLNPCIIDGIEGTISADDEGNVYFTRSEEGTRVNVANDTTVITRAMQNRRGDIAVVFIQDLPEDYSPQQYVDILLKMRSYQRLPINEKCFYVIGPVLNADSKSSAELEALLEENFGSYFINAREYICTEAAQKYKVTIRDEEDLKDIEEGRVCSAFLTRKGTLNLYGLYAISDLFTERLNENNNELLKIELEHGE